MIKKSLKFIIIISILLTVSHLAYGQTQDFSARITKEFYDGNFQFVLHSYESLNNPDTLSAHTYYLIGLSYQKLLKLQQAAGLFRKAYRLDKSSIPAMSALGMVNEQLGNFEAARSAFQKVLRADPTRISIRLALGELYMNHRKWQPAVKTFQELLASDSTIHLDASLGYCYLKLGNINGAIIHLNRSHQWNPQNTSVALQLSHIYFKRKRWEKALQTVIGTLQFHPTNARLWQQRADINFARDSIQTAALEYQKLLGMGDTTAVTLRKLGTCQVMLNKYPTAIKTLQQAYNLKPGVAVTNFYLGIAYRNTDSLNQSLHYLKRADSLTTPGLLTSALKQMAQTYNAKRNLSKVLDAYKLALKLNPALNKIYFRLAVLYDEYYKDKSVALLYYQKYLHEIKNNKGAQQKLLKQYAKNRIKVLKKWVVAQQ